MHVVVCTVVHHPADARIFYREIEALLAAGHDVTYIAPHDATPAVVRDEDRDDPERTRAPRGPAPVTAAAAEAGRGKLRTVTIPRAAGRHRLGPLRAAKAAMAATAADADLLLVHDPELLLVLPPKRARPPTVWDVHEDTAAALTTKAWLPAWLRPVAAGGVISAERLAERRLHLILAEHGYNDRFAGTHPVVPNTTYVPAAAAPPSGPRRVVYVGHISPDRGSREMTELGRLLRPHGIAVDLIGPADAAAKAHIEAAGDAVAWHGFVPNAEALRLVEGALAGLSLLQDEENFRHSMPTKVAEYMARGVPVVTTPLPLAAELVHAADGGFVVPFNDPRSAADAILKLDADPGLRVEAGRRAHEYALRHLAWPPHAAAFVAQLETWARQ
ncbi:MAG TPA: glycosyltransferase family 4 protein [Trebonia sp.]|nr:glycosyltransferase family 4 protein [Trebonia sp.]